MERFTISLDPDLARSFDALIAERGYQNRSEAVRDLLRERLGQALLADGEAKWGVGTVSYVYDRTDQTLVQRVLHLQHDHHDLVLGSQHIPLDHENRLETLTLRGTVAAIQTFGIIAKAPHHGFQQAALHRVVVNNQNRGLVCVGHKG